MRRSFFLFFLLLFAPKIHAQPLPDRRPLVGTALDADGKPLGGAVVSLRRESAVEAAAFWGASTASDARGAFDFPGAELGRYFLSAELPGYAPISNQWVVWTASSPPLKLRFQRLVTLSLQVKAPDGTPIANSYLWVLLRGDGNAGQNSRLIRTDSQGNLRFGELLPARTSIYVAGESGFALQTGVSLRADASETLTLQSGGILQISVRDSENRAVGGAQLSLQAQSGAEAVRLGAVAANADEDFGFIAARGQRLELVSRDGDGQITLKNVPPGLYSANLRLPGYESQKIQSFEVEAGQTRELSWNVTLKPELSGSLTLQLRGATEGQIVSGQYSLRLLTIGENGALEAEQPTFFFPGGHPGRRAVAGNDGLLTLFPLAPNRYRIFVTPRAIGRELEEGPAPAASLDVTVPREGATATATVVVR